jgi:ATP-dependent helicase Lhr and Lhr-like helicase
MPTDRDALARLHPGLQNRVREKGWILTDIQNKAIAAILEGHDCVIEAPTAGGKTEAVLWPALTRVAATAGDTVGLLYLAPLRALLNSLETRVERYASDCFLEAFKWHGDVSQTEKLERLRRVPHVLLTTPESLEAILLRKAQWRQMFAGLKTVIIDEAHSFAGGDRGGHVLSLLARLDQAATVPPQRIALSATVGNVEAMLHWLVPNGRAPACHVRGEAADVEEDYRVAFFDEAADSEDTAPEDLAAWRMLASLDSLVRGAEPPGDDTAASMPPHHLPPPKRGSAPARTIVFVRSRRGAENCAKRLAGYARATGVRPLKVRTHHSAISKFYREEAERLIQVSTEDGIDAIVSTSTLELGIDIGELNRVIQCDTLTSPSSFLQRVGRTGRRQGQVRFFRGICVDHDDLLPLIATVSLGKQRRAEAVLLPRRAFHLLAHQLMCLSLQEKGIAPSRAWELLHAAHVFADIDRHELDELVQHMVAEDYLRQDDGLLVLSDKGERAFLGAGGRRLFAVFDSAPMYEVIDGKAQVGTLDAAFVEALTPPFLFVLGGRLWEALSVNVKARTVAAKRSRSGDAPRWQTFGGPDVPYETAQEVGRILHENRHLDFLDEGAAASLASGRQKVQGVEWHANVVLAEGTLSGKVLVWTYAGDRINRTLARVISGKLACKATASYQSVQIDAGVAARATILDSTLGCLRALRSAEIGARQLAAQLEAHLPAWPFSPFARCLPKRLLTSALAERTLDVHGLLELLKSAELRSTGAGPSTPVQQKSSPLVS